jgi:hypothetical protein
MTQQDIVSQLEQFDRWVHADERAFLKTKVSMPLAISKDYFLAVHACTEAAFRKITLIGLRRHSVPYNEAKHWLYYQDATPNKGLRNGSFMANFERLYAERGSWQSLLDKHTDLATLWDLWHAYTKIMRNHLAHGMRGYSTEYLSLGLLVNFNLLIKLESVMEPIVGGKLYGELTSLRPRLPRGNISVDVASLLGVKKPRTPKPKISNEQVLQQLLSLSADSS